MKSRVFFTFFKTNTSSSAGNSRIRKSSYTLDFEMFQNKIELHKKMEEKQKQNNNKLGTNVKMKLETSRKKIFYNSAKIIQL